MALVQHMGVYAQFRRSVKMKIKDIKQKNCNNIYYKQSSILDCSDIGSAKCSDNIVKKLEEATSLKFMARKETDTVQGFISIDHGYDGDTINRPHEILVGIYNKTENPNLEHKTKLQKPTSMPSDTVIKNQLK